jgi:hypothetical protein
VLRLFNGNLEKTRRGEKFAFFGKTLIIEIYERAILYLNFSLDVKWIFSINVERIKLES